MKKTTLILTLLCSAVLLSACSNTVITTYETTVTEWKPSTSAQETSSSISALQAQEENVKVTPKNQSTTETQEETESELPTQGVPNPDGHIPVTTVTGSLSANDLDFVYKNKTLKLYDKIENVFEQIGEDNSSVLISDEEMQYQYEDFILYTYINEKNIERLTKIEVTDKSFSTQKGVKVGDYASALKRIYGNPATQKNGEKRYAIGKKQLIFRHKNNRITEILYEFAK